MRRLPYLLRLMLALLTVSAVAWVGTPQPQRMANGAGNAASNRAANGTELTVSAAISLKDALDEIRTNYIARHPGTALAMNYGASGTLELQIEQGAPVDIFFSAAPKQMDDLQAKGLVANGTRHDLLHNEIVLVVPKTSSGVASFQDLLKPEVKHVALGEPASVPAGQYAQQVLMKLGLQDGVNKKAVYAKDVRQVLTYVENGDADAGIVYSTDAIASGKVRVAAEAPKDSHAPVVYCVGVIKNSIRGSKNAAAAADFEAYLSGAEARAVFQKYGFGIANP